MKSTFLLSIFVLTVNISLAQNPPCNITKLDWQTAFTSDEGTVSYFMESSDCKGKELCGHPRIGLKHNFKKPIWVKVKLKGFNCDNQTVVGEFYSNRMYIAPNEVYVAAHNWHTFKTISEVVNVEVTFEETKVQSMIFNKDGNTIDTYVDGKYQKKGPSIEEIKAAAQDSAQKAQLLASVEQKPVEKQVKKPAIQAATPSVKSKNAVPFNEINPPENQEVKQAANQTTTQAATKRPVDKKAEKPQTNIPAKTPQKTVDAVKAASAPVIIEPEYTPINVLKTNILYPLSLGYEHGLGKHFSFFVNGFFMPALDLNGTTNAIQSIKLLKPSVGFAGEARYYISKEKAPLNGIYWGGFFTTRSADIALNVVSTTSTGSTEATINIPLGLQMYGLMIGKQKIRAKGFTTDIGIGVGSYHLFGIPNISPDAGGIFGRIGDLTKNKTGVAPRLNVNLGYAF